MVGSIDDHRARTENGDTTMNGTVTQRSSLKMALTALFVLGGSCDPSAGDAPKPPPSDGVTSVMAALNDSFTTDGFAEPAVATASDRMLVTWLGTVGGLRQIVGQGFS